MFILYKNKDFVGFDDINHKALYSRHLNLKKTKNELSKQKVHVKNSNVYRKVFDKYDFYRAINYKIYELSELYKAENLADNIEGLNRKYFNRIEDIVLCGKNGSKIQLSIRIFWDLIFLKEYVIFWFILFKNKINNGFRKGKRIN